MPEEVDIDAVVRIAELVKRGELTKEEAHQAIDALAVPSPGGEEAAE